MAEDIDSCYFFSPHKSMIKRHVENEREYEKEICESGNDDFTENRRN